MRVSKAVVALKHVELCAEDVNASLKCKEQISEKEEFDTIEYQGEIRYLATDDGLCAANKIFFAR
jgi:hypothetical protein